MKKIVVMLLLVAGLCSCQKDVDLNVPEQPSKLAVNTVWKENEVLTATVSRTLNIKDKPFDWDGGEKYRVTNAQVSVYQDGVLYDQLVYNAQEYKYKSATAKKAVPGFTYSMKVTAPEFAEATTAPTRFLRTVPIKVLGFKKEAGKDELGIMVDEIRIEFDDPAQETNFYQIKIQDSHYSEMNYFIQPLDPAIVVSLDEDPLDISPRVEANRIILSDQTFNGTTKSVVIRVPSYFLRDRQNSNNSVAGYISLYTINEDVFLYNRSRILDSENPFAEPVQPYTNITNGVGIFGLLSGDTKSIQ